MSSYYRNSLSDDIQSAWLESLRVIDPGKRVSVTALNGQKALVIATSFLTSATLEAAGYNNRLPLTAEMLKTDFVRLGLTDRAQVTIYGYRLQVMIIGNDPVDPIVQLTLEMFNN